MSTISESTPLEFRYQGSRRRLAFGEAFSVSRGEGFSDTPANELQAIISAVVAGRPWREEIAERFGASRKWLHDIVLSPKRSSFLDQIVPASSGDVLDIGCGWGQLTLPLAKSGRRVVAIEPVTDRIRFVQVAADQERCQDNIAFVGADFLEVEFERSFTTIFSIGVLEWAGAFQDQEDPQDRQRRFLRKARAELVGGGALVIGIENRLGLKYLLGCPDDHLGCAGIGCLSAELAKSRWQEKTGHTLRSFTYSDVELITLLHGAGFTSVELFAALPDYKLPELIIPLGDGGTRFNELARAGLTIAEHNGYNGEPLPLAEQRNLHDLYQTLGAQEIAHHFAPSFFVRAR